MTNQTFNYFYNGVAITKSQFEFIVPQNWQDYLSEYGSYSYGYYKAELKN